MVSWRARRSVRENQTVSSVGTENLHLSLAQMRTALNSLPMGVIIVDQAGNEWWRNRAAHDLLDAASSAASVQESLDRMSRRVLRGHAERSDLTIDGPPPRNIEIRTVPLVNGGGLIVLEDVTERFLTDRVRTDFVANISHELKTPVGALSILAETILGEVENTPQATDLAPLAQRMVAESQRMARTIDDLLELASIEFGGPADSATVSMQAVVAEAVARISPFGRAKSIEIVRTVPDVPVEVGGDMRQLVSAVSNLVENAVKYSGSGSSVTVHLDSDEQTCRVSVSDSGIGIAPEHLDRVFERFYRADPGRARETGGTGLGLAIVRHIATNHGGEVTVTSTEGEGTTFTLHIPVARG